MDNGINKQTEITKTIPWNWKNSFLLFLTLIFVIGLPLGGFLYLEGRFTHSFGIRFYLGFILFFYLFFSPLYIVWLIIKWKRFSKLKRTIIIIQNAVIIYFLIGIFSTKVFCLPGYIPFTYGFRSNIKATTDVSKIQEWLKAIDPKQCTGQERDILSKQDWSKSEWPKDVNWPDSLTILSPHYVCLSLDENNKPKIRLTWGGVFGHWGLEIGSKQMKIPPTQDKKYEGSLRLVGEYRLPLSDGVYVWREIR